MNEDSIRQTLKDFLFENQVSASGRPDGFTNSRMDMYNRPGFQADGSGEEVESINIPLAASDHIPVNNYIKKIDVSDENYIPKGVEMTSALVSLSDSNNITDATAEKIWKSITDILKKV